MAPFGKNFLKTRLKSRTRDAEAAVSSGGKEIQVSVCEEEKVVCGVTKHTTCADMVQALLEDHRASGGAAAAPPGGTGRTLLLHGDPKDFCLLERWRGFERALPPLTRILRLWNAWGDQKPFIHFLLVKTSDFVAQPLVLHAAGRNNNKASGSNNNKATTGGTRPKLRWEQQQQQQLQQHQFSQSLPVERQKRMVKKAFRKLEKLHKSTSSTSTSPSSPSSSPSSPSSPPAGGAAGTTEDVDRMVQLILSQDHSIRGQIQRMRQLDLDIQRLEEEEARGRGSLQPVLEDEEDSEDSVEEQVLRHKELIMELSLDIDAELRRVHFDLLAADGQEEEEECVGGAVAATTSRLSSTTDEEAELERLGAELSRGLSAGLLLRAQTAALDEELACYEAALGSRDRELWRLAAQLRALQQMDGDTGGGAAEEKRSPAPNRGPAVVPAGVQQQGSGGGLSSQTVRLKHGLSSPTSQDVTDTDSDTGISSTHSQDSLSPCLDFPPPPLDTDV